MTLLTKHTNTLITTTWTVCRLSKASRRSSSAETVEGNYTFGNSHLSFAKTSKTLATPNQTPQRLSKYYMSGNPHSSSAVTVEVEKIFGNTCSSLVDEYWNNNFKRGCSNAWNTIINHFAWKGGCLNNWMVRINTLIMVIKYTVVTWWRSPVDGVGGLGGLTVQANCLSGYSHYPPPQPPAQLFPNWRVILWLENGEKLLLERYSHMYSEKSSLVLIAVMLCLVYA